MVWFRKSFRLLEQGHSVMEFAPEKWPRFVSFPVFLRDWERLGLDSEDLRSLEQEILKSPTRAPVTKGTGGLRKLRFAGRRSTRGKSGACRVCYVFFPEFGTSSHGSSAGDGPNTRIRPKGEAMGERASKTTKGSEEGSVKRPRSRSIKLSAAGTKIVSAFEEAVHVMRSGGSLRGHLTARSHQPEFARPSYGPEDVRRVRELLSMSQVVFARFLGVDPNTVRSWEQGNRPPSSIARRFMGEIEDDPSYWKKKVASKMRN
jgi:DNA-binding transcriptional regulator YiaG